MIDILYSSLYALIFLSVGITMLVVGWFVLDFLTPGHRLGDRLAGHTPSHSAALVASAWMLAQAAIIFTAIWTNAHGTDLWMALGWTVAFSIVGLFLQTVAFVVLDAITPGNLGDEVCAMGPTVPLAKIASANIAAVGLVVIASIA